MRVVDGDVDVGGEVSSSEAGDEIGVDVFCDGDVVELAGIPNKISVNRCHRQLS